MLHFKFDIMDIGNEEFKRGEAPLQKKSSPSPWQGEGDKGDGVKRIK
jgi:hypothetical protein